jgi:uncharacterized RDD family membrane protein YckC
MEEAIYTVVKKGKPTGPYTLTSLITLGITADTFVRKPGMDDYKEAHELPELCELLGFHHQQAEPQYFASFDQRIVAHIIDYLVVLACYIIIMLALYVVLGKNTFRIIAAIGLGLSPIAQYIYGSIAEASIKQATIGKGLMDIKVTDLKGNRISLANSLGRNFGRILFSNSSLGFGYLYLFLNKKQQCLHDVVAETLVVKQRLV